MTPFTEFALVILTAGALGLLATLFRQPPLVGYIIAGLFLGPLGLNAAQNSDLLHTFSEFGVTLLLFVVGLELNWQSIKRVGAIATRLALLQMAVTLGLGLLLGRVFSLGLIESIIIGLALSFSSTIVVLKLIATKNEVQSLFAKLAVGILLLQDVVAVILLVLLPSFTGQQASTDIAGSLVSLTGKIAIILAFTGVMARWILPGIWHRLAHNRELMLVASIGWCFFMAILAKHFGFSYEIGAFAAGLSLATTPYSADISHNIRPVRDLFVVLFFVLLGFSITPGEAIEWPLILTLTTVAVLLKPLALTAILTNQRFRLRTSFMTSFYLGQLSEFSVILALTAHALGLISSSLVTTLVIATALTFAISSYLITGAEALFARTRRWLLPLERKGHANDRHFSLEHVAKSRDHVVIFGYHRMGFHILRTLQKLGQKALVVDFNPDVIDRLRHEQIPSVFGDADDPELLEIANVKQARMLISTIPHLDVNLRLIASVKKRHRVVVVAAAEDIDDALEMYRAGADYVILPQFLGGEYLAELLEQYEAGTLKRFLARQRADAKLARTKEHALYFD